MFSFSKKTTIAFCIAGILIISALAFKATGAGLPFGGFVTASIPCTCSGNFLLTISGPVGGQFVFQPGMPQFPYAQLPRPGVWALGLYEPGGICLTAAGKGCSPLGAPIGTITPIVGTSL